MDVCVRGRLEISNGSDVLMGSASSAAFEKGQQGPGVEQGAGDVRPVGKGVEGAGGGAERYSHRSLLGGSCCGAPTGALAVQR